MCVHISKLRELRSGDSGGQSAESHGELNIHGNDDPYSMLSEAVYGHFEHPAVKSRACKIIFNNYVPFSFTINLLDYFKLTINDAVCIEIV